MKRRHCILSAIVLAGLLSSVWLLSHPRQLPVGECSEVFQMYRDVEGVDASFIKDFPVNDTLRLDVTTLMARDSAGWQRLKRDFRLPELPDILQQQIDEGRDLVSVRLAPKSNPSLPMDTVDMLRNHVVAISRLYRTISVFCTRTEDEQQAVSSCCHEKGNS